MFPMDKLENAFIFCSSKLPKSHHLGEEAGLVSLLRVFSCFCLLWEPTTKQAGTRCQNPKCFLYNAPSAQLQHCFQRPL